MTLTIVIIVAILFFTMVSYNGMIKLSNRVKAAWADIDVQLKRRYNLIPNIVETVKGYAAHEEDLLIKVTEARAGAINATNVKDQGLAENALAGALKSLFAVAENYPDLKANENFLQLQGELVDTEDKIQAARRFYNSIVRDFNTKIQQFPATIIAKIFKFKDESFFEIEDGEQRETVKVNFNKEGTRQAENTTSSDNNVVADTKVNASGLSATKTTADENKGAEVQTTKEEVVAVPSEEKIAKNEDIKSESNLDSSEKKDDKTVKNEQEKEGEQ